MKKFLKSMLVLCLTAVFVTGCGGADENSDGDAQQGSTAPAANEMAYASTWAESWNGKSFNPDAQGPAYNVTVEIAPDLTGSERKVLAPDFAEEFNNQLVFEKVSGYSRLTQPGQIAADINGKFLLAVLSDEYTYVLKRSEPGGVGHLPNPLAGRWYTEDKSSYYILNADNAVSNNPVLFSADDSLMVDRVFRPAGIDYTIFTEDGNILYVEKNLKTATTMADRYTIIEKPFALKGDTLTITTPDGSRLVLTKGEQ